MRSGSCACFQRAGHCSCCDPSWVELSRPACTPAAPHGSLWGCPTLKIFNCCTDRLKERKKPIFVSDKKGCHLCHNTFSEPNVVCLPGGVPVHTHCVAQRVRDSPTKRQLTNSSNHT
ncbi:Transforming growth factor-beta receptor-associated protein 1-like protein [Larimichthys crocea]|uniref:Uncharacterized protein n=1 Tax=Larimichthys crocea TaxID=215358 RepID=A0ACD3R1L7_LARCR|nr:Transforming growth factor-beta receptor-associated protein 1-like protein [Larimichthys crocea]